MLKILPVLATAAALLLGAPAPAEAPTSPVRASAPASSPEGSQAPAPAQDDAEEWQDYRTPKPEVVSPLSSRRVQVEVLSEGWGVRRAAREFDREVPGLRVFTRGTCEDRPRAVCVRVVAGDFGEEEQHYLAGAEVGWYALTTYPSPDRIVVYLNTGSDPSSAYACAAHEFAHVLGLAHHDRRGVVGKSPDVVHLSPLEIHALRSAYGEQR